MILLRAVEIEKSYGRRKIIDNVSMQVSCGEIILIRGKSGSGKSTLLHLLSMIEKPDHGMVWFREKSYFSESERSRLRREKFGFMFQDLFLMEDQTPVTNIMLAEAVKTGNAGKKECEESIKLFASSGISEDVLNQPVRTLSGGERSRIAFLRAVAADPEICFCDEPTGNLDSENEQALVRMIHERSEKNKTAFVIVSHRDCFDTVAHQSWILKDGKLEEVLNVE